MKHYLKRVSLASGLVLALASSASALGLDLGGARVEASIGGGGVNASANVGGSGGLDAEASLGGSGASADVSLGGGTAAAPGTTPGTTPGATVPGTTVPVASTPAVVLPYDIAALVGSLVVSSDQKAIGYVESAEPNRDGRPMIRIRLIDGLGAPVPVVRVLLRKLPPKSEAVELQMTKSQFLRQL